MPSLLINIPRKQAFLFAVFLVFYEFLTYIANDMIMPGMIQVVESFHGSESAVALSLSAYVFGGASLQIFLGPISDRFGRRPVMISGACLFFLCSLFIAATQTMDQFLWARFFQGMGLCFIGVIGYATLQEIFSEMDAIRLVAIMTNVSLSAPLLGPLLGAAFISYFNWRIIFLSIAIFALIALWGLWRFMPEPVGQIKRDGEEIKRESLSLTVVLANYKALLWNPSVLMGSLAIGVIFLPCMAWIGLSPVMIVNGAHQTILQYALWQLPIFGAFLVGNCLLHYLTHSMNIKQLIIVGSWISGLGLVLTGALPLIAGGDFYWLIPGLIGYFFGAGMVAAPLSRLILFATPVSKGTTSAFMTTISSCIQAAGLELVNILYASHNNVLFGGLCAIMAGVYLVFLIFCLRAPQASNL